MKAYNTSTGLEEYLNYSKLETELGIVEDFGHMVVKTPKNPRFVVTIPHCGLHLPSDFPRMFTPDKNIVNDIDVGAEDIFDLYEIGGIIIKSRVHRNTLDLNRIPEVDVNFKRINKKTGKDKYFGPDLTKEEEKDLLEKYHEPFYDETRKAMEMLKQKHGRVFLINGHTFDLGLEEPGICVGDGRDFCSPDIKYGFIKYLEKFFRAKNKSGEIGMDYDPELRSENIYRGIGLDYPFDGTDGPPQKFGNPQEGCNALLIEFSRGLFVDSTDNEELFVGPDLKSINKDKIKLIRGCLEEAINGTLTEVGL